MHSLKAFKNISKREQMKICHIFCSVTNEKTSQYRGVGLKATQGHFWRQKQ